MEMLSGKSRRQPRYRMACIRFHHRMLRHRDFLFHPGSNSGRPRRGTPECDWSGTITNTGHERKSFTDSRSCPVKKLIIYIRDVCKGGFCSRLRDLQRLYWTQEPKPQTSPRHRLDKSHAGSRPAGLPERTGRQDPRSYKKEKRSKPLLRKDHASRPLKPTSGTGPKSLCLATDIPWHNISRWLRRLDDTPCPSPGSCIYPPFSFSWSPKCQFRRLISLICTPFGNRATSRRLADRTRQAKRLSSCNRC